MDCETTLELLESVRPNSEDLHSSELAEAVAHLTSCAECSEIWSRRSEWDQAIRQSMFRVKVPVGLKENLLALTSEAEHSDSSHGEESSGAVPIGDVEPAPAASQDTKRRNHRRMLIAATTAVMVIGFGIWFSRPIEPKLRLNDLLNNAPLTFVDHAEFSGDFDPTLPIEWQRRSFLIIDDSSKGWLPKNNSDNEAALFHFYVATPKWATTGMLLVVPSSYLEDPPVAGSMSNATLHYRSVGGERYQATAWTDPDTELVYVCFVAGRTNELERLATMLERYLT